jgi:hypothetical protein
MYFLDLRFLCLNSRRLVTAKTNPNSFERKHVGNRVARWFVFIPKIPIWENFGGPQIENF